jgi:hypothetical protein
MAKQTFTTGQVLTAAQMTSLQQTAMAGGAASAKTASYTLVAADAGTAISMSNASATTITVNTALFAAGDTVHITNLGAGVCTITAGTATVNSSASLALAQYESGFLDFTSTSAAIFVKGAGAAATSGGMTLLSTTTLSGASVTISSIDQGYVNLFAIISGVTNATGNGHFRVAPNAQTNKASYLLSQGNSWAATVPDYIYLSNVTYAMGSGNNENIFTLQINNYASATKLKTFQNIYGYNDPGNTERAGAALGYFKSTTAISSLVFENTGGNLSTGTVLLYGVK